MPLDDEKRKIISDSTIYHMLPLWMRNFAQNTPLILGTECPHCGKKYATCRDVRELVPEMGPAIIIGNSPSLERLGHLKMLAESGFKGKIICTDKALIKTLKAGIVPHYVCSVDGASEIATYYRHSLVQAHAHEMKAVMNSMVHPDTLREFRGERYIFNSNVDNDSPTSLTRAMHYMNRHTIVPGTGDVGGFCIQLAIGLDFSPIGLIGISYAGYELKELGDYIAYVTDTPEDKREVDKYFWKHTDPHWKVECWTSALWESCWEYVQQRISTFGPKKNTTFINCSGMGLCHGEHIQCMDFAEFLEGIKNGKDFARIRDRNGEGGNDQAQPPGRDGPDATIGKDHNS